MHREILELQEVTVRMETQDRKETKVELVQLAHKETKEILDQLDPDLTWQDHKVPLDPDLMWQDHREIKVELDLDRM